MKKKICCIEESRASKKIVNKSNLFYQELLCHLPMAILSLSLTMLFFVFFDGIISSILSPSIKKNIYLNFFHISHYIHILCASFATYFAFIRKTPFSFWSFFLKGILSAMSAIFFCSISDIIFPSWGGFFLQQSIPIHLCFLSFIDGLNLLLFTFFGLLLAVLLFFAEEEYALYVARGVHTIHIVFGVLSAFLYIFSKIEIDLVSKSGFLYIILFFAVVLPCIFSDLFLPYIVRNRE